MKEVRRAKRNAVNCYVIQLLPNPICLSIAMRRSTRDKTCVKLLHTWKPQRYLTSGIKKQVARPIQTDNTSQMQRPNTQHLDVSNISRGRICHIKIMILDITMSLL